MVKGIRDEDYIIGNYVFENFYSGVEDREGSSSRRGFILNEEIWVYLRVEKGRMEWRLSIWEKRNRIIYLGGRR